MAAIEETDRLATEPLSPELVLVDPELARFARDRLPDPGQNPFPSVAEDKQRSVARPRPATPTGEIATEGIARLSRMEDRAPATAGWASEGRASSRARWRNLLLLAVGLVLAAAAFFALTPTRTGRELSPAQVRSKARNPADAPNKPRVHKRRAAKRAARPASKRSTHPAQSAPAKKHVQARPKKLVSPSRPGASRTRVRTRPAKRAGNSEPKTTAPAVASEPTAKHAHPVPPSAFGTRVFIWPAQEHATLYRVAFFRHGRQVFEALASEARLELPLRWVYKGRNFELTSGAYSWTVWPAFGPRTQLRYGKPIVQSNWVAKR
jgi:hypothetical protein